MLDASGRKKRTKKNTSVLEFKADLRPEELGFESSVRTISEIRYFPQLVTSGGRTCDLLGV